MRAWPSGTRHTTATGTRCLNRASVVAGARVSQLPHGAAYRLLGEAEALLRWSPGDLRVLRGAARRWAHRMKRTPMKRGTKPMAQRSKKRISEYAGKDGRAAYVAQVLELYPRCQIASVMCAGESVDVHESILRSRGGAIVPGPKAEAQGQRFFAICRDCHNWVHRNRELSEVQGWLDPRNATQIAAAMLPLEVSR